MNHEQPYGTTDMTIAYISHPACSLHDMGGSHPEAPARLAAIEDQLLVSGLEFAICRYDAPPATREQLCRVHDPDYVDRIVALSPATGLHWIDADTAMNPHTLEAARHAAGAVVSAVDLVLGGTVGAAFCAVRPPGHHAGRAAAMGFCFFNNIAVGPPMPWRNTACNASPLPISTSTTATAPRTSSGMSRGCCSVPRTSIRFTRSPVPMCRVPTW